MLGAKPSKLALPRVLRMTPMLKKSATQKYTPLVLRMNDNAIVAKIRRIYYCLTFGPRKNQNPQSHGG
ncbi:unnamed protein product [Dibothriocephalus latus]|uniref:Uncharacterized protein n=1 Tax=Dibothriocephalus latus TaxID=60516 RepID=A0A3P7P7B8_DIBLA|nr:unnamed protein product [Dibothriocephalus latus]